MGMEIKEAGIALDPVCGMTVDKKKADITAVFQGRTFYFCSLACKKEFEKSPGKYTSGIRS